MQTGFPSNGHDYPERSLFRLLVGRKRDCEAGISLRHGRPARFGNVDCIQQHLLLGGER